MIVDVTRHTVYRDFFQCFFMLLCWFDLTSVLHVLRVCYNWKTVADGSKIADSLAEMLITFLFFSLIYEKYQNSKQKLFFCSVLDTNVKQF